MAPSSRMNVYVNGTVARIRDCVMYRFRVLYNHVFEIWTLKRNCNVGLARTVDEHIVDDLFKNFSATDLVYVITVNHRR